MTNMIALKRIEQAFKKKAKQLDLSNCGLTEIPQEIICLSPNLQQLFLGNRFVGYSIYENPFPTGRPNNFGDNEKGIDNLFKLENLKQLYLQNTHINKSHVERIKNLTALTALAIDGNRLRDEALLLISKSLTGLTHLSASKNAFSNKWVETIVSFEKLKLIVLNENHISNRCCEVLGNLKSLELLALHNNLIGSKGLNAIAELSKLRHLWIGHNSIEDKGIEAITKLQKLVTLHVSENKLSNKSFQAICSFKHLQELYIADNFFTDRGCHQLHHLHQLRRLNLGTLNISDYTAEHISNLSKLEDLEVYSDKLTDVGVLSISRCKKLKKLALSGQHFTDRAIEGIAKLSLTNLAISCDKITSLNSFKSGKPQLLNRLQVSSSSLTDNGLEVLSSCHSLEVLSLRAQKITHNGLQFISHLKKLTQLRVSYDQFRGNKFSDDCAIAICNLKQLEVLLIDNNSLTSKGFNEISQLRKLSYLDASRLIFDYKDNEVSFSFAMLKHLNYLNLSNHVIGHKELLSITKLSDIYSLNLTKCGIDDRMTTIINQCINLESLKLGSNKISDKGAIQLSKLSGLQNLIVNDNFIGDKGIKAICQLKNINELNISGNNFNDEGLHALCQLNYIDVLDIGSPNAKAESIKVLISKLVNLKTLKIRLNNIKGLPVELADDLHGLRAFFSSIRRVPNKLVKLVFVGNSCAGKSSLAEFLTTEKFEVNKSSTHGIKVWRWKIPESDALEVNIWDFGGQDYYHSTHNLFLDQNSIFVVLYTEHEAFNTINRLQDRASLGYWLGNIREIAGGKPPILLVASKNDLGTTAIVDSRLIYKYEVYDQFSISVKSTFEKDRKQLIKFRFFKESLIDCLNEQKGHDLPISWVYVRDHLLPLWRSENIQYIDVDEFLKNCINGLSHESDLLEDFYLSYRGIINYLTGCGEIIVFHSKRLQNRIFLDLNKLTSDLYDQLLTKKVLEQEGILDLSNESQEKRDYLNTYIDILFEFGLIIKKEDLDDTYIVPQYLPENYYEHLQQKMFSKPFVMHFSDYMPRSIISEFLNEYADQKSFRSFWRYGCYFNKNDLDVLVRISVTEKKIYIHTGSENANEMKKMSMIKELFMFFSKGTNGLTEGHINGSIDSTLFVRPGIELSLNDKDFASIRNLRSAIHVLSKTVKATNGKYINIDKLLSFVVGPQKASRKRIFLSYSHKDEVYKKELDNHLSGLKRSNIVESWNDRKINVGEDWDQTILDCIASSDIMLLLLSPDFMSSEYIWKKEIETAKKNDCIIIPIFLRHCDYKENEFELHKLQGLPADAKWIVNNDHQNRDESYLNVVNGIKELLEL